MYNNIDEIHNNDFNMFLFLQTSKTFSCQFNRRNYWNLNNSANFKNFEKKF